MKNLQQANLLKNAIRYYGKKVNYFSLTSLKLTLFCKGNELGHATGFIVKNHDDLYLATNWHVLAGRCAICGQPADRTTGALPDTVQVRFHLDSLTKASAPPAHFLEIKLDLWKQGKATWRQHVNGQKVDVACLKLPKLPENVLIAPINTGSQIGESDFFVGSDVFILGFPGHVNTLLNLPLWKRGSIATELLPENGSIFEFLIDSATRVGMSGSPIIVKRQGGISAENGKLIQTESRYLVLGIYSGRIASKDPLDAVIGQAWPFGLVEDVIFEGDDGTSEMIDTSDLKRRCSCKS